jgi:Fe2+ or Zn2+ uptake regulation protein/O6-methylguanine-DNA--protein-cysteine methyltransferase
MPIEDELVELLRERGLRVTPQRRAILGAFEQSAGQHLSADEVHTRAAAVVPDLGRGTVYAALAELTELGILSSWGSADPVRYETNTASHQHFRCHLCMRLFDVAMPAPAAGSLRAEGFVVEQMTVTAAGVCSQCVEYDKGLRAGARRARNRAASDLPPDVAADAADTPVGTLRLGATPKGVVRVVFDNHSDVPALDEAIRRRRGSRAAREHLTAAKSAVAEFFSGGSATGCAIDWDVLPGAGILRAAQDIPRAQDTSYDVLDTPVGAEECGRAIGANPVAVLVPCHRVTRGREVPGDYVGGSEAREALRELERA